MIDQNTALWIVATACLLYIAWMDVRPFVAQLRSRSTRGISVDENLAWSTVKFEAGGTDYYKNHLVLNVWNDVKNRQTIRDVRVRAYTLGDPMRCLTLDGEESVALHHGEVAQFVLGSVISQTWYSIPSSNLPVTDRDKMSAEKGVSSGSYYLSISEDRGIGLRPSGDQRAAHAMDLNPVSFWVVRVSAENQRTKQIRFRCHPERLDQPQGKIIPPFEIIEITEV
jgi:hypothetical protein